MKTIKVDKRGSVTTLWLAQPDKRNAIGPVMVSELREALDDIASDRDSRVVVLAAEGKVFSAGGDLSAFAGARTEDSSAPLRGDFAELLLTMVRFEKPIIASVHANAMGGGVGLTAACTFAFMAEGAELALPEIDVGIFPMMIMAVLSRFVPRRRLLRMMLTGERISAGEAARIGLIDEAVPAFALESRVRGLADVLADKSPTAIRMGLKAFGDQDDLALAEALPMLRERLYASLATDDAREGLQAFVEKRKPNWTGN